MPRRKFDPWEVRPESDAVGVVGRAKAAIGILADDLKSDEFKKEVGIKVSEVFKGGSLGQGTQVPFKYDIDLVLYSESITVERAITERGYKELLDKTKEFLVKHGRGKDHDDQRPLKIDGEETHVGIKFIYPFFDSKEEISIDLFLSPNFPSQDKFLESFQGMDAKKRIMFSVSASKWQTRFISRKNQWPLVSSTDICVKIKQLSRRLKAWRNITWEDSTDGRPSSYLLMILVVIAFDRLPDDKKMITKGGMNKIVPLMTQNLRKLVLEIESDDDLDLSVPGANMGLQRKYKDLLPSRPRIIDPANPVNNLYLSGVKKSDEPKRWTPFATNVAHLNIGRDVMKKHEDYIKK